MTKIIEKFDIYFFDLDGTLIDTEKLYFRFWKEASKFYGYELNDYEALSFQSLERNEGRKKMREYSNGLLNYDVVREKRIELMNQYLLIHPIEVKEGVFDFLRLLKEKNKKIYIVTANAYEKALKILKDTLLYPYVDAIISAKDVERGKPFPDVYLKGCAQIGCEPSNVVVFEDSKNGLLAASRAGCYTIMVEDLTKYNDDLSFVDGYISSFKEIL